MCGISMDGADMFHVRYATEKHKDMKTRSLPHGKHWL